MRRIAIAATIAIFSIGSMSTASAQTGHCGQNNQFAGGVIGAIVGGTAGGLIVNDRRRGFSRGGFRRGRGFRRNNNGVGIAIGALAGGLIGSQIANTRSRRCVQNVRRSSSSVPFAGTAQQTSSSGPFGGQQPYQTQPSNSSAPASVPPPLNTPAPSQSTQAPSGVFQPVCQFVTQTTQLPNGQQSSQQIEVCQFSPDGEWIPR